MSSVTGCVNSSQLSLGLATNLPSGNNIPITFDSNYDIMVYNIGTGEITFYTNVNQIIIPNPNYYVIAVLNPETNISTTTNITFIPNNPPSQKFYGFVITQPSSNAGQNSNGTYTINVNGLNVYFNTNIQSTLYMGYGQETPVLSPTLFSVQTLIQQLEGYYPLQVANEMNQMVIEDPICGNLVGSPDNIVFTPSSSGTSTSHQQSTPFIFGTTFYPNMPPLPPAPPKQSNNDLVTLGITGALLVAGTIVARKVK